MALNFSGWHNKFACTRIEITLFIKKFSYGSRPVYVSSNSIGTK